MSWDPVILASTEEPDELVRLVDELFAQQRNGWPALKEGEKALSQISTKEFREGQERIVVQANPGRRRSTYARVDPESVAQRPCFLCPEQFPPQERGVAFRDLVILPNPYPVISRHCTIPAREHTPQRLTSRIPDLLELSRALGPEMLVLYNGPRCGASAPDHFHFQAGDAREVPLFSLLPDGGPLQTLESFGRRMLLIHSDNSREAGRLLGRILDAGSEPNREADEPMVSVLSLFRDGQFWTTVFPRSSHRPACFFAEPDSRIAVSPAALEMAGLLVVAEPAHFDRVDRKMARTIYQEVSLDPSRFQELVRAVT